MNIDNPPRRMVALLAALCAAFLLGLSPASRAAEQTTILVVGDSLSSGYRLQEGEGWVDLLARDLGRDMNIVVVNDSISGDTTAGGVARLPSALRRIRPDWVLIELGGNDGLRGNSLAAMEQNLATMVRLSRARGATPVLLGMKLPPNYGEKYTAGFERVYERVAAATGAPLLAFFLRGIEDDPALFQEDGIHPNAKAQGIIMQNVRGFLTDLIEHAEN